MPNGHLSVAGEINRLEGRRALTLRIRRACFEAAPESAWLGQSFVRKPLYSREGANVEIMVAGEAIDADEGPYGAEGFIKQAVATLPRHDGNYAVLGSWLVGGVPCGLSVREDVSPINKNTSRFVPHAIIE